MMRRGTSLLSGYYQQSPYKEITRILFSPEVYLPQHTAFDLVMVHVNTIGSLNSANPIFF